MSNTRRPDESFKEYQMRRQMENDTLKYRLQVGKPYSTGKYIFWLSFADAEPPLGKGHLGVVIIRADSDEDALIRATAKGLNPSGDMSAVIIKPGNYKLVKKHMNKLLSRNELENIGLVKI